MIEEEKQLNNKREDWWRPAMFFYAKVTSWIILPILVAVFLSKYVDRNNQILFFVLIIIGFGITCFGIYKEIKIYQKNINKEDGNK